MGSDRETNSSKESSTGASTRPRTKIFPDEWKEACSGEPVRMKNLSLGVTIVSGPRVERSSAQKPSAPEPTIVPSGKSPSPKKGTTPRSLPPAKGSTAGDAVAWESSDHLPDPRSSAGAAPSDRLRKLRRVLISALGSVRAAFNIASSRCRRPPVPIRACVRPFWEQNAEYR